MALFEQMEFNELVNTFNLLLAHGYYSNLIELKEEIERSGEAEGITEEQQEALLVAFDLGADQPHDQEQATITTTQAISLIIGTYKKGYISLYDLLLNFDLLSLKGKITQANYKSLLNRLKIAPGEANNPERKAVAKELGETLASLFKY